MVISNKKSSKGELARERILAQALALADAAGLDALTIGSLADAVGKSKSGVFAHFGAREDLLLAVLDEATQRFGNQVFVPAMKLKRGLPRLRAILTNAVRFYRDIPHGCLILSAAHEFDDQPGPIRDAVIHYLRRLQAELLRAVNHAQDAGELRDGVDSELLAFECFGVFLAAHHSLKALRDPHGITMAERAITGLLDRAARVA
jgi:AcrR family transcriptional regulator